MELTTIGIDIGKNVFHLVGMGPRGRLAMQRKLNRAQLPLATANIPACLIGLEACPGAHHQVRSLEAQGRRVRLLPPQYVRLYVKANKNDFRDAEATRMPSAVAPCASSRCRRSHSSICRRSIACALGRSQSATP